MIPFHLRAFIWIMAVALLISRQTNVEAANAPSGLLCNLLEHPEKTVITTATPEVGWIYNPSFPNDAQTAYRIIVAASESAAAQAVGDVWDSSLVKSPQSINVPCTGLMLKANTDYFWRVQTVDSAGETSPFSAIQHFHTDTILTADANSVALSFDLAGDSCTGLVYNASSNIWANRYPLKFMPAAPVLVTNTAPGRWFIDFGQDAFGYVTLHLKGAYKGREIQVRFGEMACSSNAINAFPPDGSNVRYTNICFALQDGDIVYPVHPPRYPASLKHHPINPPDNFGVVMPFRYLEITNFPGTLTLADVTQERLMGEFNTNAAAFSCSSPALNQIWNLCRNSMQILSFDGIYVDGDRERLPYEADCYIHQLSSYAVDREFSMARYSFEYLLQHPTWPTEWKFHMVFIAWADYLQTGNADLLRRYYDALKPDVFTWAATGDGLMKGFPNFPQSAHSDVVDWPEDDRDGFIIKKNHYLNWTNSVNNAFYYRSLQIMKNIAAVVGHPNDAASYGALAEKVYASYNNVFWNSNSQCYVDGVGTTHAAAHANFFPLAFGLVPAERKAAVIDYLHSRIAADNGMPASVYGAQYLLTALFENGDADTALDLMTTNGARGWYNMINLGSTLTTEAWSFQDKGNTDWNHPWGAAPGNLISRFVLGVRPLEPGFGRILIQPHLGTSLAYAQGIVPTIRGPVFIQATNVPGSFKLVVNIPGNITATVQLPAFSETNATANVDGHVVSGILADGLLTLTNIGSGQHAICVGGSRRPMQTAAWQWERKSHAENN